MIRIGEMLLDRFDRPLEAAAFLGKPRGPSCEPDIERSSNVESFAMTLLYVYDRVRPMLFILSADADARCFCRRRSMAPKSILNLKNGSMASAID